MSSSDEYGYGQIFTCDKLSISYPDLLEMMRSVPSIDSRIGPCREIIDFTLELYEPEFCVVDRDHFNHEFMMAEIVQILAGQYDHDLLKAKIPRAAELITPLTAYGPRIFAQLPDVVEELKKNPASRRAVVYIGRENDLASTLDPEKSKARADEMPCTCLWQFFIRGGQLNMIVYMRSWDLVWGLCYDVPSFVAVQMAVASALDLPVGIYTHHAGSGHVYRRHDDLEARPNVDDDGDLSAGELVIPWIADSIDRTAVHAEAIMIEERKRLRQKRKVKR